jgi:tRNA-2-methylthio-N6-dimethylallyladenosine synthase
MNIMTEEMRRYQQECSAQVREIMEIRARGPKPLASVHVFGCQQNVADAERMKGMLAEMATALQPTTKKQT